MMRSQDPLVVRTVAESACSIGCRMGDMRDWLDLNRIELSGFRPITLDGEVAFDAQFRDLKHAALFRAAFGGLEEGGGVRARDLGTFPKVSGKSP